MGLRGAPEKVEWALDVLQHLWPYHDGPAHIVLADFNLDDSSIQWCIDRIDAGEPSSSEDLPIEHPVFQATKLVLVWLLGETTEAERTGWL